MLTYLDDTSGGQSMIVEPDLDQPVFIKCTLEVPILLDYDGATEIDLELKKGSLRGEIQPSQKIY